MLASWVGSIFDPSLYNRDNEAAMPSDLKAAFD